MTSFTIAQIRQWLGNLNSPGMTVNALIKYYLNEESINRANEVKDVHVENENSLEDIRTPQAMERIITEEDGINPANYDNEDWRDY